MNQETFNTQEKKTTKKIAANTVPIRVKRSTSRNIRSIVNKINKKNLGRKATFDDVVLKALSLLHDKDLEEIKESTYSSEDRLELQYRKYCKENTQVTKDKFLEILLQANLPSLNSPATEPE